MKRSILLSVLSVTIMALGAFAFSCTTNDGLIWTGPDYPAGGIPTGEWTDRHAMALTDDINLSVISVNDQGEAAVLMTRLDASRKIVDVKGVVYVDVKGDAFVVRFDENGWPSHAVFQDDVLFYGNWTDTTVDVAVMHPDGTYEIISGLDRTASILLSPAAKPGIKLQPVEFDTNKSETVLEKMPEVGIRSPRSSYNLSPYGRAMMAYSYSSGYSIVPPRLFDQTQSPQNWTVWALGGIQLGVCGLHDYPGFADHALPCEDMFAESMIRAMAKPEFVPFQVATSAGFGFGNVSPISDVMRAYNISKTASVQGAAKYDAAVYMVKDITDWTPIYFQGKEW